MYTAITQQMLRLLFLIFYKIHIMNLGQLDLSCKNLVFFSATAMIAHCIDFSCLNAHSHQILLCTEERLQFKFAKCLTWWIMHLVFSGCITWNVLSILNLILLVDFFTFCYYVRLISNNLVVMFRRLLARAFNI